MARIESDGELCGTRLTFPVAVSANRDLTAVRSALEDMDRFPESGDIAVLGCRSTKSAGRLHLSPTSGTEHLAQTATRRRAAGRLRCGPAGVTSPIRGTASRQTARHAGHHSGKDKGCCAGGGEGDVHHETRWSTRHPRKFRIRRTERGRICENHERYRHKQLPRSKSP